ncbi:MAG: amidohydrolase [Gammaproteobacteria bacterium]|nr:amidohydrolase [Gammaproteobacteria bacterium]MYJ74369.1 amidohydrolase [Gammaproteobacteria bacterium]
MVDPVVAFADDKPMRSADSHVIEPGDLWQTRLPKTLRDRAPRIVDGIDSLRGPVEGEWLVCEGISPQRVAGFAAADVEDPKQRAAADERGYGQLLSGGWDPVKRLKDQEVDGVGFEVLYPSMGLPMYGIPDFELQSAVFAAYNDWVAEYASHDPSRLLGVGMICVDDIGLAVAEMERIARLGLRGAMISVDPGRPNYASKRYDRVWAAACALELPLSMHILTDRGGAGYNRLPFLMTWMRQVHPIQLSLTTLLVSGVFHRYPKLKVVSVENDIGWIPYFLQRLAGSFEQFRYLVGYDSPQTPVDYFRRNVWFTFQDDPFGVSNLASIGVHRALWGSDYPHGDSTWPHSRETVKRNFAGLDDEIVERATYGNLNELYGLDP